MTSLSSQICRGGPTLKRKRRPGIGRWSALIVLTAASTLPLTGLAQASTAPNPTPTPSASASPNPSAAADGSSNKPLTSGKPGGTCEVTRTGHITDCQRPVAKSKFWPGARNTGTVGQPVTDLASLVDTRTGTTGGGNTVPGAEVPYGMVQWSRDTMPDRNAGGGYSFTDTTLTGYSLTHVSGPVSYTHLRAHETRHDLVCRLLLEKKKKKKIKTQKDEKT